MCIWLHWVLVAAWGIFICGMWNLVPWPGIKPGPLNLQHRVLATRDVPEFLKNYETIGRIELCLDTWYQEITIHFRYKYCIFRYEKLTSFMLKKCIPRYLWIKLHDIWSLLQNKPMFCNSYQQTVLELTLSRVLQTESRESLVS